MCPAMNLIDRPLSFVTGREEGYLRFINIPEGKVFSRDQFRPAARLILHPDQIWPEISRGHSYDACENS